jgi:four helix bundle protein
MTNDKTQMTNKSNNAKSLNYDLDTRSMEFATKVAKLVLSLTQNQVAKEYSRQLIRSSASIGANIEEADGTLSKRDFINKLGIARREARESKYWLKLINNVGLSSDKELLDYLIKASTELLLILSSIINKTREKL